MPGPTDNGAKTGIGDTAVALTDSTDRPSNGVTIFALATNSAPVYVGKAGVTTSTGYPVAAGAASPIIGCVSPSEIYLIAASGAQEVRWITN